MKTLRRLLARLRGHHTPEPAPEPHLTMFDRAYLHPTICRGCDRPFSAEMPEDYDRYCATCSP